MIEEKIKMTNALDNDRTRAYLKAKRDFYGADTPIGHRCSNILEQIESFQRLKSWGMEVESLSKSIALQSGDLEKLCAAAQAGDG